MAQLSFDLSGIVGQQPMTRADDVRAMFEPYNRTIQQWQMAKNDVSRVPGVNRLAMLQAQQQVIVKQAEQMATRLRNQQTAQLAALNTARTAAIKASSRGGGGGGGDKNIKNMIDAFKAAGQLKADNPLADFVQALGTLDASLTPVAAAIAQDPDAIKSLRQGQKKAFTALKLDAEQAKAISSSRLGYFNDKDPQNKLLSTAKKIGDATALLGATIELSQGALRADDVEAARSAIADYYGLKVEQVSAEALADVQGQVRQYSENVARDPVERKALQEIGFALQQGAMGGGRGGGGGGGGARVAIPSIPKLSPAKQAALDKYLAALSDDGIAKVGELVGAGMQVGGMMADDRLTQEDITAGIAAYEEARRTGAYTPEQAPLFERRYISLLRQQAEGAENVARQQEGVLQDYEMDAVGRQRAMARQFLDLQNAAEGLRVPLAYEAYGSTFERQVMGEMMDIVRKEGELVYDTGALPMDRERGLGGRGSSARAPHRFAKQLYSMDKSRPGGVQQSDVIPLINKRFRDPRDQERALAYFLAMKEVDSIRAQTGARVEPGQPGQVVQEAQAAMQSVQPTPTPAAGVAGRGATRPTAAPAVETPSDEAKRDPFTADMAGNLLIDPATGAAATAGMTLPREREAAAILGGGGAVTIPAGYPVLPEDVEQYAPEPDYITEPRYSPEGGFGIPIANESAPVGMPRTEYRFDTREGEPLFGPDGKPIINNPRIIGAESVDDFSYLSPRSFFLQDVNPYDFQRRAPLVGPPGARNQGLPRKLV